MQNLNQKAVNEIIKSCFYLVQQGLDKTTKVYEGIVIAPSTNPTKWKIKYNGKIHEIRKYGEGTPKINNIVEVFVPQGNNSVAWFFVSEKGGAEQSSVVFTPSVSEDGVISWVNNGGLVNPSPVNIKGQPGDNGVDGKDGTSSYLYIRYSENADGTGMTESPTETSVYMGVCSSNSPTAPSNNKAYKWVKVEGKQGKQGIQGVQGIQGETGEQGIQGVQGEPGKQGVQGNPGKNATINGYEALTLAASGGLDGKQEGSTFYIDGSRLGKGGIRLSHIGAIDTWANDGSKFYSQVDVPDITPDIIPIVLPKWGTNQQIEQQAWNAIDKGIETFNGYVRFYASTEINTPLNFCVYY